MVWHIQAFAFISSDENVVRVCEFSAELTAQKMYPWESLPMPLCLSPHLEGPDLEVKSKDPSIARWCLDSL